jgi:hypothetical protein
LGVVKQFLIFEKNASDFFLNNKFNGVGVGWVVGGFWDVVLIFWNTFQECKFFQYFLIWFKHAIGTR